MTRGQRARVMEALRDEFRKQARAFEQRFYAGEWDDHIAEGKQVGIAVAVDPSDYVTPTFGTTGISEEIDDA